MKIQSRNNNTSFSGKIQFYKNNHELTKAVDCCSYGDKKFVKFILEKAKCNRLGELDLFISNFGHVNSIEVGSPDAPRLNKLQKSFFCIPNAVYNRINKLNNGKYDRVYYEMTAYDYHLLKTNLNNLKQKDYKDFENAIKSLAKDDTTKEFLENFFITA